LTIIALHKINIPQFRKSAESATPTLARLGVLAVQSNRVLCKKLAKKL